MASLVHVVSTIVFVPLSYTIFYRSSLLLMVSYHIRESNLTARSRYAACRMQKNQATLCDDHLRFMQSGGNYKHAKSFNDVIY